MSHVRITVKMHLKKSLVTTVSHVVEVDLCTMFGRFVKMLRRLLGDAHFVENKLDQKEPIIGNVPKNFSIESGVDKNPGAVQPDNPACHLPLHSSNLTSG
jgi:hypothetical protein